MQMETANSTSILPNPLLPDDLIWEGILPRLPVKSLTRFKSVSKDWRVNISSYDFVKKHLKFSKSRLQSLIIHGTYVADGSNLISFDEGDNLEENVALDYNLPSYSPHHPPRGSNSYVIGSRNGLVCLYKLGFCFYIWNPATNQCNNVSRPPDFNFDPYDEPLGMGFGYVASIEDYRIGLLINDYDNDSCNIYVYSLRAQDWITMPSLELNNEYKLGTRYEAVVVDDTLYWPPSEHNQDAHLAGLNLVTGQMEKVPWMMMNGYNVRVFRMKGRLFIYSHKSVEGMDLLWLFENGKSLIKLDSNQAMLRDDDLSNEEGGDILLEGSNTQFELENTIRQAWDFTVSLISPFGTNLPEDK